MRRVPRVTGGEQTSRIILPARLRPMGRAALQKKLVPVIADWLAAAIDWDHLGLGESRCLAFETDFEPDVTFYVRFWSEPHGPLLGEIAAGHADPTLAKHLNSDALEALEERGFQTLGGRQDYRRSFAVSGPSDVAEIAELVVQALTDIAGYQGLTPLFAVLAHDSRAAYSETIDSFSEEEIARVFRFAGFTVKWIETPAGEPVEPPEFHCTKAGTTSTVSMIEPIPGMRLYARVRFAADLPMTDDDAREYRERGELPADGDAMIGISAIHAFTGGVTTDWLVARVHEWDTALAAHRREVRKERKRKPPPRGSSETIH